MKPMLCKNFHERYLKLDRNYICQIKHDGFRIVLHHNKRKTTLALFRECHDISHHFPKLKELRELLLSAGIYQAVIDGEIISPSGRFKDLPALAGANTTAEVAHQKRQEIGHPNLVFFDLMEVNGSDLRKLPFFLREAVLMHIVNAICMTECCFVGCESIIRGKDSIGELADRITEAAKYAMSRGHEGIIVRDALGSYEDGKRSSHCLKIKGVKTYDVVITGFNPPEKVYTGKSGIWGYWVDESGQRVDEMWEMGCATAEGLTPVTQDYFYGRIGAIRFGVYKNGDLIEIGKCRGFTNELCVEMSEKQEDFIGKTIEIVAQGIIDSKKGSLRHPRFSRLRPDKNPKDCTWLDFLRS